MRVQDIDDETSLSLLFYIIKIVFDCLRSCRLSMDNCAIA